MYNLGIDLGGTNARAALVTDDGKIVSSAKIVLKDRSPAAVIEAIAVAASQAQAAVGARALIRACGVGVAAQLQGDTGRVLVAPNLEWFDVPFGDMLATRLGRKVHVFNDLSVAAWGEFAAGAGRGVKDIFVCFVGSGVGSALIFDGRLVHGATGVAGEFGHIKVVPGGRRCGCGEQGCLEAYVGGHNLIDQMRELVEAGRAPRLLALVNGDLGQLHPGLLEKAALEGEPASREIYEQAGRFLALSVANQITVLNPARVILGGGVLGNLPGFRQRIAEAVGLYTARVARAGLLLTDALLGDDGGLIGAALLAQPLG